MTSGKCQRVVKVRARKFGVGQWSFIGSDSEKKWYSAENSPQGAWDHIADEMLLEFVESGHPTFRATTPLSRSILKSKGHEKLSIHFTADYPTIEIVFRIIISVNQLSIYGAVAAICEEFENHQDGTGEPEILMGQSIVQFWRIKFHLRNHSSQVQHWSDERWKSCLTAGGGSKRRYQYYSDNSCTNFYLRALQGPSGHNLIDPTLQDNVMIESGIFHHIYHIGCAFNLHSIINNGLIPRGQDSSRRQTVFFLPIDPRDKDHEDPEHIDFSVPRRARYVHSAWKKHQDAVFWVDIDLAIKEGLTFYQTRSNAIILQRTLPAYCIPKVVRLKTGEVLYEKSYLSPRTPPTISLRHDHDWTRGNDELGSTVEQQPVGELVQQSFGEVQHAKFSKPTQPKPKPICDRSVKPEDTEDVFVVKGETSPSHEIDEKGLHEELGSSDRSGKPEKLSENIRVKHAHDETGQPVEQNSSSTHTVKEQFASEENRDIASFNADNEFNRAINEENIDFNIPRVPHSAVKRSHGVNVRNLIQKMHFKVTFNNIDNSILSAKNHKT